eukprot:1159805-Pelagomonas_calceolata.AAC.2
MALSLSTSAICISNVQPGTHVEGESQLEIRCVESAPWRGLILMKADISFCARKGCMVPAKALGTFWKCQQRLYGSSKGHRMPFESVSKGCLMSRPVNPSVMLRRMQGKGKSFWLHRECSISYAETDAGQGQTVVAL